LSDLRWVAGGRPGAARADRKAAGAGRAATAQGDSVRFGIDDGRLTVNNANIIMTDVEATNGVIHVIDTVLLPPGM